MKKFKRLRRGLLVGALTATTITTFALTSCSLSSSSSLSLRTQNATNFIETNNSPLNPSFTYSPISTYAQSSMLNLVSYQSVGNVDPNEYASISNLLVLEAADALFVFKDETTMTAFDTNFNISTSSNISFDVSGLNITASFEYNSTTYTDGTDYWVFFRDRGSIQFQQGINDTSLTTSTSAYYSRAISSGTIYQFSIDTNNQWVDSNGESVGQNLSSKDFERSTEFYAYSSAISYNRNSYFLDLLGLDTTKTVGTYDTDVENYKSVNDQVFTFYLQDTYPYALDLLSKDYFAAVPYSNQKVKNISADTGYIALDDTGAIDEVNTEWNQLFGSGSLGEFTDGTWYAGPYYVSDFSSDKLIFRYNNYYWNSVGNELLNFTTGAPSGGSISEQKIEIIDITYGSGTTDTFYESFKSGQTDYVSAVPSSRRDEALDLYQGSELQLVAPSQLSQSNYITFTPVPYTYTRGSETNITVTPNANISENVAFFIYKWNSEDSVIVRAAIAGLINHNLLSRQNLLSATDFQLSGTPYGTFANYYESVADGTQYGGLPRPYSDYSSSSSYILDSFTMDYYDYSSSSTITKKELTISTDTLQDALRDLGATTSSPLVLQAKFGEGSFSEDYTNYLNTLKAQIETISGGLITFTINARNSGNPTANEWYSNRSSPLGYSYWSPDYNGIGTWIEASTTLQQDAVSTTNADGTTVTTVYSEGRPSTNSHSGYFTYLSSLVTIVKLSGATYNESTKTYSTSTYNAFDGDRKVAGNTTDGIAGAFSNENLTALGFTEDAADGKSASQRYIEAGLGLLNLLLEKGVFTQSKFKEYVDDPTKLNLTTRPSTYATLYPGSDVIASGQSANFSKWLGVYAGQSNLAGLYATFTTDSDYYYIPRSESGLTNPTYTLITTDKVARASTVSPTNYRDFGLR